MADELLSEASVRRRGLFRWDEVDRLRRHVGEGDFLFGKQVFSLLALELWFRIFVDREAGWHSAPQPPPRHPDWRPAA